MRKFQVAVRVTMGTMFVLGLSSLASAQATRTWVSGVGDDANPGSRTAPCKTFAGAIAKTAAGGEINVIDPGGFGAVTITKSITINGEGTFASILASGTNGIVVNAGANDKVTIRHVSINGGGNGLNGIRFLAGGSLHVENCDIFNFSQKAISAEPSGDAKLFVRDTIIRNNGADPTNGGGILIKPGASGSVQASLDNVRMDKNIFGLRAEDRSTVDVRNSSASGNDFQGFVGVNTLNNAANAVKIRLENCMVNGNNNTSIRSVGGSSFLTISNVTCVDNLIGLSPFGGGQIISFGNNRITGNGTENAPTSTISQQ